ncbi:MAG: amidohydrolase family protein [Armatimonadota bacterium]
MRKIVDSHVHLDSKERIRSIDAMRERTGAQRMAIACLYGEHGGNSNEVGFAAKEAFSDSFYVLAALDHTGVSRAEQENGSLPLDIQLRQLLEQGADGIKIIESKPNRRKSLGIPIDSDYFEPFFALAERLEVPILWHVADPPEFWDPRLIPDWATKSGWGYDETFPSYEQLISETLNVLQRHPGLRVTFAHFLFLSCDLSRASWLLESYENVHLDLAPGIELFYNLSQNPRRSRDFFTTYATRIIFGTDIYESLTLEEAECRAGIVRRFLETGDEFRVPEGADRLLGKPEDGVIRGLNLPDDILRLIYAENFERLVGSHPRPIKKRSA